MHTNLYVCGVLIAVGMLTHWCKKLHDLEQAGTILTPMAFARRHPYQMVLAFLSGYLLAAFFYFIGQLNEVTSILTGVACSSAYDSLRARAVAKLNSTEKA